MNFNPFQIVSKVNVMIQGKMSEDVANRAVLILVKSCAFALICVGVSVAVSLVIWVAK